MEEATRASMVGPAVPAEVTALAAMPAGVPAVAARVRTQPASMPRTTIPDGFGDP
jgi:hypothetical protein